MTSDPTPSGSPATWVVAYQDKALAVYKEIAAHLTSVPAIRVELQWNTSTVFRYEESQIAGLIIQGITSTTQRQVEAILTHYGSWEKKPAPEDQKLPIKAD
jgi:hypothetical protein